MLTIAPRVLMWIPVLLKDFVLVLECFYQSVWEGVKIEVAEKIIAKIWFSLALGFSPVNHVPFGNFPRTCGKLRSVILEIKQNSRPIPSSNYETRNKTYFTGLNSCFIICLIWALSVNQVPRALVPTARSKLSTKQQGTFSKLSLG